MSKTALVKLLSLAVLLVASAAGVAVAASAPVAAPAPPVVLEDEVPVPVEPLLFTPAPEERDHPCIGEGCLADCQCDYQGCVESCVTQRCRNACAATRTACIAGCPDA